MITDDETNLNSKIHAPSLLHKYLYTYLHLSIVSVAKAPLCLRCPSIIMSYACHTNTPFFLGMSSTTLSKLESRKKFLDMILIPEKGHKSTQINHYKIYTRTERSQIFIVYKTSYPRDTSVKKLNNQVGYCELLSKHRDEGDLRTILLLRSGDVELNPGPKELLLASQNCRGLKNNEKLKQLLNSCQHLQSKGSKIVALQESHLENSMLKYMWSGNFALTPSQGAKGCVITLLSPNIVIHEQRDLECEGHVLLTESIANNESIMMIIVNLHAPCPHDNSKLRFFELIHSHITDLCQSSDDCNVIILGDFNTTFWQSERINTSRNKREVEIALKINRLLEDFDLKDSWNDMEAWR